MREGHENRTDLYAKAKAKELLNYRNSQVENIQGWLGGEAFNNFHDVVRSPEANRQLDRRYEGRPVKRFLVHTGLKVMGDSVDVIGGRKKYWKK